MTPSTGAEAHCVKLLGSARLSAAAYPACWRLRQLLISVAADLLLCSRSRVVNAAVCHQKLGVFSIAGSASCRRTYADLVQQLRLAEIDAEAARFTRWEKALAAWRTLRTQHAMQTFNARIQSPEFAEPLERLQLYLKLREVQQAAFLVSCLVFGPGPVLSRIAPGACADAQLTLRSSHEGAILSGVTRFA